MIAREPIPVLLTLTLLTVTHIPVARSQASTQSPPPIYLPRTSFWKYTLPPVQTSSGNSELDEAYWKYFFGDQLSSRAHLYKALSVLGSPENRTLALRAESLRCLLDMHAIPDSDLLSEDQSDLPDARTTRNRLDEPAGVDLTLRQDDLLSARWKMQAGDSSDPSLAPWVELFDAYQLYQHGDRQEAFTAWKHLAETAGSDPALRGLAWLGVGQIAGERIRDEKNDSGPAQTLVREALQAAGRASDAFVSGSNARGIAQAHLLAAEIDYLAGFADTAQKELHVADDLFQKADDRVGWVDANLVAALGFNRSGNTPVAEETVLAMEEAPGDLRISEDLVQVLATFSRRLPGLTGITDTRPIASQLADARDFQRWASATADPLLMMISLQVLSQILHEGNFWNDASFYDAVRADLAAQYRTTFPLAVRIKRAALLDYDFLRETKQLEQGNQKTVRFNFSKWADLFVSEKKGMRDEALKSIPDVNLDEAQHAFDDFSKGLKELAGKADDAGHRLRERMATGDRPAAAQALADMFGAFKLIPKFLNIFDPSTRLFSGTENVNKNASQAGKRDYEIHAEVAYNWRMEVSKSTSLEILHGETYLNMIRDVLVAVTLGDERYVRRGVKNLVSFYDQYRNSISPPDLMGVPFSFQTDENLMETFLPTEAKTRDYLIDEAVKELTRQYREKVIQDAISDDPRAPDLSEPDSTAESGRRNEALLFFQRNWHIEQNGSRVESNQINKAEQNGKMVVTINHSYTRVFVEQKDSDYSKLPPASSGIDIKSRARLVRDFWDRLQVLVYAPRFDKILETFYTQGAQDRTMEKYLGATPEQLAQQGALFSSLVSVGQLALSAKRSNDFLVRPGSQPFDYWKKLLQSDATAHGWASTFAQLTDPDLVPSEDHQQLAENYGRNLMVSLSKIETAEKPLSAAEDHGTNRLMARFVAIAQALRYRPFLLLLLDDKRSADLAAQRLLASRAAARRTTLAKTVDPQSIEDGFGLALYFIAAGSYDKAIGELKLLPELGGSQGVSRVFQFEYLLAMCYRRAGDRASETDTLRTAIENLEKLRRTLRTRNQALALQSLRQMIYEEYLNSLFSQKRYSQMAEAMRRYKRSNQLPIAVLLAAEQGDSQLMKLVRETTFLYDVLSRDDVWQVSDAGSVRALIELFNISPGDQVDSRQTALSGLNQIADALVDEIQPTASTGAPRAVADPTISGNALAISYFVGSRGLYRIAINRADGANVRYVPIAEGDLSKLCAGFRTSIQEHKEFAGTSSRLYGILLGELPELGTAQRLYLSPDGALNYIPFQALRKDPDSPYFVDDHILSYLSEAPAPAQGQPAEGNRQILLVGNPDGTLPAAEREAKMIAQLQGLEAGEPLLRSSATLENLQNRMSGAGLVHFATHARANPTSPNFAYLQLANGERLYSIDLGGLRFSGKQVFLSACETRIGQDIPGEDIYGLADSFLASGAASVVSTLWRIESDSSAVFAQRYYGLLAETHNAAEALAMTEREFIHGKWYLERGGTSTTLDAPLYWAGFNHLDANLEKGTARPVH